MEAKGLYSDARDDPLGLGSFPGLSSLTIGAKVKSKLKRDEVVSLA
jgi:hypothetical protein